MSLRPLLLILALFPLAACQQVAWKAGSTGDDLKRDEQICRAQIRTEDDDALKGCLRAKGWTVTDFKREPAAEEAAPENAMANDPAPVAAVDSGKTVASTGTTSTASVAAPATATTKPAAVAKPKDPLQRQSVQTWWKAGAQASDFKVDESACLTQLGETHTPDYVQHLYARALMNCLQTRGWHAGYDPVYTPLR